MAEIRCPKCDSNYIIAKAISYFDVRADEFEDGSVEPFVEFDSSSDITVEHFVCGTCDYKDVPSKFVIVRENNVRVPASMYADFTPVDLS